MKGLSFSPGGLLLAWDLPELGEWSNSIAPWRKCHTDPADDPIEVAKPGRSYWGLSHGAVNHSLRPHGSREWFKGCRQIFQFLQIAAFRTECRMGLIPLGWRNRAISGPLRILGSPWVMEWNMIRVIKVFFLAAALLQTPMSWQRIGLPNVSFASFYHSPKLFSLLWHNYCSPKDTIEVDGIPWFPVV